MKYAISALAAFIALTTVSEPVAAQMKGEQQVGSRIARQPRDAGNYHTGQFRDALKRCYYATYTSAADKFLAASDPATEAYPADTIDTRTFRDTRWSKYCNHGLNPTIFKRQMSMSPSSFRYMMLEAAYLDKFPTGLPTDAAPVTAEASAPWGVSRRYVSSGDDASKALFAGDFADCIAARDPSGADRILRTSYASKEEREAAEALVPTLGACLVDGSELPLSPVNIRSFAADGMWQRYVASMDGKAAT